MSEAGIPETGARTEVFPCDGPVEIDVNMRNGLLDVRAADVPGVRVQLAIVRGDAQSDAEGQTLRESEVSFSDELRRLQIRTPRSIRRFGIAVSIEVPEGSQLAARLHRGSVTTSGVLTALRARTGSGTIQVERVNGDAEAATGMGDLRLGRVTGRLRARSGSGRIEVDGLEGERATVATGNGDVQLGVVQSDVQARTGNGRVAVSEAASGRLDLVTGSGDVTVAVRRGVGAEIDMVSGSGEARSELDVADLPPAQAPPVRVRARTGSGKAVVARAGG